MGRLEELKALLADSDPSDPFSQIDIMRWQGELYHLLPRSTTGRSSRRTGKATNKSKPGTRPIQAQGSAKSPLGGPSRTKTTKPSVPPIPRSTPARQPIPSPRSKAAVPKIAQPGALSNTDKQSNAVQDAAVILPTVVADRFVTVVWDWCIHQSQLTTNTIPDKSLVQDILSCIKAWRKTRKQGVRQREFNKLEALLSKVAHLGPPGYTVRFEGSMPRGRSSQAAGHSTPRSTATSAPGEGTALYQRLPVLGRGLSFEDSVSLRQQSRQGQRRVVNQADRTVASGSQEDYEDIDW